MPKTTIKRTMWLTDAKELPAFISDTPQGKLSRLSLYDPVHDYTDYGWIKIGEATISADLPPDAVFREQALKIIEEGIAKVSEEFTTKMNALKALRSDLLCLEAPKQ